MSLFVKFFFFAFLFFLWLYLDKIRSRYKNLKLIGWGELLWGLFFIFLGSLLDLATELFPINRYLLLDQTPWALVLKFGFYILGIILLIISPLNWLRTLFEEREQSERFKEDFDFTVDFTGKLKSKKNSKELFSYSLPELVGYLRADGGFIFLFDPGVQELTLVESSGLLSSTEDNLKKFKLGDDILSLVLKTKKTEIAEDIKEQKDLSFLVENEGIRSLICAPLLSDEMVWGGVALFKKSIFGFSEKDEKILSDLGRSIGDSLRFLNNREELEKNKALAEKAKKQKRLFEKFLLCLNIKNTKEFLKQIVMVVSEFSDLEKCHFFIFDKEHGSLKAQASLNPEIENKSFSLEKYPLIEKAFLTNEVLSDDKGENVMVIPVLIDDEPFGALFMEKSKPPYFSSEDFDFARSVGCFISSFIGSQKTSEKLEMQNIVWDFISSFSEDMITVHNRDQVIINANDKTSCFLDLPQKDILGQRCYRLLYQSDYPESCPCLYSFKTKKPHSLELVLNGNKNPFLVRTYPLKNERGEVIAVVEQISEKVGEDQKKEYEKPQRIITEDFDVAKEKIFEKRKLTREFEIAIEDKKEDMLDKRKPRILAVDDQQIIRELLENMLEGLGYQTEVASSGAEALKLFEKKDFDLVLTDLGMPGMSGWEVSRTVKRLRKEVPVILFTGLGVVPNPGQMKEYGIDYFLTKPFKVEKLDQLIKEALKPRWKNLV